MTVNEKAVPNAQILSPDNEFWIFGYGYSTSQDRRVPGYIKGYVRRFWQDHRGTPVNPGRVVTLIERGAWNILTDHHSVDEAVWGMVYRIKSSEVESVKEYLDIREINGYSVHQVEVHQSEPALPTITAIVYIGTPSNPQFVGNPPPNATDLARRIYYCRGPSGENREYLYQLHKSLIELCPDIKDNHVHDLQLRVALIEESEAEVGREYNTNNVRPQNADEVKKMSHSDLR
ncbi:cation transport protein [Terfezia claveryi]|nr:cation transport protein [Terfezia claveryi]